MIHNIVYIGIKTSKTYFNWSDDNYIGFTLLKNDKKTI